LIILPLHSLKRAQLVAKGRNLHRVKPFLENAPSSLDVQERTAFANLKGIYQDTLMSLKKKLLAMPLYNE